MRKLSLIESKINAGFWQGLVLQEPPGAGLPQIAISHLGEVLENLEIAAAKGGAWAVSVAIPPRVLCDGLQVFLLCDLQSDEVFGHFSILTGAAVAEDSLAEIALLRAEVDMLKKAFRSHCRGSDS
ncbi:MAG: hypothetical protein WBH04_17150 [Albidovulum sp.]